MIDSSSGKHREIYLYTMSESWSSIGMPCQPAGSLTQTQPTMHDMSFGTGFATNRAVEELEGRRWENRTSTLCRSIPHC
jgi:hypothetical protein